MSGTVSNKERDKYAKIWSLPQYSENSPGAEMVQPFLNMVRPTEYTSIADIGCGSGAASRRFQDLGFQVFAFDLTDTAWTHTDIAFCTGSIWQGIPWRTEHAFCCDVMEHIPTEYTALSLMRILEVATANAFFSISFQPDNFGAFLREPLHLTVKPFEWWLGVFNEVGIVEDARDLMGEGVFQVRKRKSQ